MKNEDVFHSFDRLFSLDITEYIVANRSDIENETIKKVHFERTVLCIECNGLRTKDVSTTKNCSKCMGSGRAKLTTTPTLLGDMVTSQRCEACEGAGKIIAQKCVLCKGEGITKMKEEVEIKMYQAFKSEHKIAGKGNTIIRGENITTGDLIIHVKKKKFLWFEL